MTKSKRKYFTTQTEAETHLTGAGYVRTDGYYGWQRVTATLTVFASVRYNGHGYFIATAY